MRALTLTLALLVSACTSEPSPPSPEQTAVFAQRVDAELVVPAQKNAMAYTVTRLEAPAGTRVRIVMDNTASTSPTMVHNVVVLRGGEADVQRIGRAAAGDADHIPNDPAVIAATPLAEPGQKTAAVFTMPPAGTYPFTCTYPGHFQFMQGTLVSTPS